MRTQHNPFVRGVRYLCYLLAVVGLLALMTVSTLTVIDAVMRRYFASSIDGLSDVLEWCIVVAVSACFPAMLWRKNAITVRVLGTILPWRAREALDLLGDLLLLAVIATVAWQLTLYTRDVWRYGDVTMLMGWPKWPMWVMASVIWGFAVLVQAVMSARQAARLFAILEPPPVHHVEKL